MALVRIEPKRRRPRGSLRKPALERVHKLIRERMSEKLTLQDIADAACVSRFHFARAFRLTTGESPMVYLQRARVEQAKALLARGESCIGRIAATLGFFDQSHFSRSFRRQVGVTPSEYLRHRRATAPCPCTTENGGTVHGA